MMKNIGSLTIYKGKIDSLSVKMFDAIPYCDANCDLFEDDEGFSPCPYEKKTRCELRRQYINTIFSDLRKAIDSSNQMQVHKMSILILPLYSQLISFQLAAHMKGHQVRGAKGGIDPVYREIRETVKIIHSLLKDLGVDANGKDGIGNFLDGDGTYVDNLMKGN